MSIKRSRPCEVLTFKTVMKDLITNVMKNKTIQYARNKNKTR